MVVGVLTNRPTVLRGRGAIKQRIATSAEIADDVAAIGRLEAVGTALKVLRRTTGLRIALVARVTPESWTACAVLDEAGFGLKPGDQLELSTTY
jgi:hypothetical protein